MKHEYRKSNPHILKTTMSEGIAGIFSLAMVFVITISTSIVSLANGGGLDNTFDNNGRLATDFDGVDVATDVVIQPDGKTVVVGLSGSSPTAVIARYNIDGSLDTSFSGDGKATITARETNHVAVALRGNKIIVASYFGGTGFSDIVITQLLSNGDPDTTFDGDGMVLHGTRLDFLLGDLAIQPDGKIVVVGGAASAAHTPCDWLIYRFTQSGALDTTFSGDGVQQTDFGGNSNEYATAVTILSNGLIVVAGAGAPADQVLALARYTTNGSLDTSFGGGDGKVTTNISSGPDVPRDVKIDPSGRIVVGGSSFLTNVGEVGTVVRYTSDGVLDNSFDGDGILQSTNLNRVEGLAIQWDSKIIFVGGTEDFVIGRFNPNGTPDASFGNAGFVVTDMTNGSDDEAEAVALMRDGRIVVAGSTLNTTAGATRNFCVARYLRTNVLYRAPFDFNGDGWSDYGIFRPSNGQWWIHRSLTGGVPVLTFGVSTDRIAPADYTGDGKTDIAFFRPSTGEWYILRSENSSFYAFPFGSNGDMPVPADYDGDGKADVGIFRPSNATWYIIPSSGAPARIVQFGLNGDQPVVGDYDEDGKADIAIFRPGPREWWISLSSGSVRAFQFGNTGDKPVQGDYTGDGKTDVALFRPATGEWFVLRSEDGSYFSFPFGTNGDAPVPADYDGDGRMDPTVVRGTQWLIAQSTDGVNIFGFGAAGDRPVTGAFVP